MSLGSDQSPADDPETDIVNALAKLGILSVVSSGNARDITDIGGAPGNARSALTVANSVGTKVTLDGIKVNAPARGGRRSGRAILGKLQLHGSGSGQADRTGRHGPGRQCRWMPCLCPGVADRQMGVAEVERKRRPQLRFEGIASTTPRPRVPPASSLTPRFRSSRPASPETRPSRAPSSPRRSPTPCVRPPRPARSTSPWTRPSWAPSTAESGTGRHPEFVVLARRPRFGGHRQARCRGTRHVDWFGRRRHRQRSRSHVGHLDGRPVCSGHRGLGRGQRQVQRLPNQVDRDEHCLGGRAGAKRQGLRPQPRGFGTRHRRCRRQHPRLRLRHPTHPT